MRLSVLVAVAVAAIAVSSWSAAAQTIYEPSRYQYRPPNNGPVYYYGGSDSFVFEMASRLSTDPGFGRVHGLAFASSTRAVRETRSPVYSDAVPGVDLSRFGYTPADAYNASQAAIPTYFRKADLLRRAIELPDGVRVVPPTAGSSALPPSSRMTDTPARMTDTPARGPGVIIILPARRSGPGIQAVTPTCPTPQG